MKIRWTLQARADLQAIREYIARDSPIAADRMIQRIRDAVTSLIRWPESGSLVLDLSERELREVIEVIVGNYRAVYRIRGQEIQVLTVIHGARDWSPDMLPPGEPPLT